MTSYSVRVFGSIWRYRIQKFGWQTCAVYATGAKIELLGGLGGMFPWEIFKIVLSKMQFPAFPGLELVNRESLLRHQKLLTKNYLFDSTIIIIINHYGFAVVYFLVDSKTISNRKECTNPQ